MKPHKRMPLVPTSYIAKLANISAVSVNRRALARGIKPAMQAGRAKLWRSEDVERLLGDIGRGWVAKRRREELGWVRKAS